MLVPSDTLDEEQRVQTLHSLAILDSERETLFQDIVSLGSYVTGCPISLISLIDSKRQWFKARVGLQLNETHRDVSFCGHAIHKDEVFIVENALQDDRFFDNPLVTGKPHIRFYAGAPLTTSAGFRIGTLCVLDSVEKKIDETKVECLRSLARQATFLIERRKNELVIEATRRNSHVLFERSPAIIVSMKGPNHLFDYANLAHRKLLQGIDAVGKCICEVQPEVRASGLLALLDEVYSQGETRTLTNLRLQVGLECHDLNCFFSPSYALDGSVDGVMGIIDDVTERRNLERELNFLNQKKEAKYHKMAELVERAPMAIALLEGQEQRVVFANRLYRDHFFNGRCLEGKTASEIFLRPEDQQFKSILARVYATGNAHIGKETCTAQIGPEGDEKLFYFNFIVEAVRSANKSVTGVFLALSDVSEQVFSQANISSKVVALTAEREIRERFVATLSHDLRTPLTAARMSAERLSRKAADPEVVKKLSLRIMKSIDRGEVMVRDLLDANQLQAGEGLPVSLSFGDFANIVNGAIQQLKITTYQAFNVRVEAEAIAGYWDACAIERVIYNLVSNALKYGDNGERIVVKAHRVLENVELSVHNQGPTLSQEEQRTLFDKYRRLDHARNSGQKGWGIGLTLVKGIAEAHKGTVRVESEEGKGTVFYVLLPLDSREML